MKKLFAILLSITLLCGVCVFNVSAQGEQKVYFEYPDSWSRDGLNIDPDTHTANVYCYAYVIYGNQTGYKMKWQAKTTKCVCEDYDGEQKLFSYDLAQNGTIEDNADYGIVFSTTAGYGYMTVDMTMTSDCVGDRVYVTPYNGMISRQSSAEPTDYYAAWKNSKTCGPKAAITSLGTVEPGVFPVNQPKAQHLSDALAKYLATYNYNKYFQYENNMYLCGVTGATPFEVYNQYLMDYSHYFVGEPITDPSIPCPFYGYVFDEDLEEYINLPNMAEIAAPGYVRMVLGIKAGDVNGDNSVDVLDASEIQKYSADKAIFTDGQKDIADINRDGAADVFDAAEIQKIAAGKNKE